MRVGEGAKVEGRRDSRLPGQLSRRSGKTRKAAVVTLSVGFPDAAANSPPLQGRAGMSLLKRAVDWADRLVPAWRGTSHPSIARPSPVNAGLLSL